MSSSVNMLYTTVTAINHLKKESNTADNIKAKLNQICLIESQLCLNYCIIIFILLLLKFKRNGKMDLCTYSFKIIILKVFYILTL
jgi:hypothetical protein